MPKDHSLDMENSPMRKLPEAKVTRVQLVPSSAAPSSSSAEDWKDEVRMTPKKMPTISVKKLSACSTATRAPKRSPKDSVTSISWWPSRISEVRAFGLAGNVKY